MTKNNNLKIRPFTGKGFDGRGRSWEEVDEIVKKMQQPDYHQKSRGLSWNATPTDKAKYEIQQNILRHKRENNLSEQDLKQILGIKEKRKLECLLFAHIENFSLDELFSYAEKLTISLQVINEKEVSKKNVLAPRKCNGRVRKHA